MYKSVEHLEVLGAPHTQICGGIVRLGHYTFQMWQGHVSYVKPVCLPHIFEPCLTADPQYKSTCGLLSNHSMAETCAKLTQ